MLLLRIKLLGRIDIIIEIGIGRLMWLSIFLKIDLILFLIRFIVIFVLIIWVKNFEMIKVDDFMRYFNLFLRGLKVLLINGMFFIILDIFFKLFRKV